MIGNPHLRIRVMMILSVWLLIMTPLLRGDDEIEDQMIIYSESAILMDAVSGQVLYARDMHRPLKPASITKIMTALLALELGKPDEIITMSYEAVYSLDEDSTQIALDEGEQITLEQALYALALESANDAANGIAEHLGGSMAAFAEMMSARALSLGAQHTNFANAHGLDDDLHYTTVYDMALITREAIKNPRFLQLFSAWEYVIPPTNIQPETRILHSANEILPVGYYDYEGLIASKTGWTDEAMNTIMAAAQREGRTLIVVLMRSDWRDAKWLDATSLLDYGFNEFIDFRLPAEAFDRDEFTLTWGSSAEASVDLRAEQDFTCLLPVQAATEDIIIEYVSTPDLDGLPKVQAFISLELPWLLGEHLLLGSLGLRTFTRGTAEQSLVLSLGEYMAEGPTEVEPLSATTVLIYRIATVCGAILLCIGFATMRRHIYIKRRRLEIQERRRQKQSI